MRVGLAAPRCRRAAIHTQSPVRSAERTGKVWRLTTDDGTVTADWIAVATDVYGGAPWQQVRREQIFLASQFRDPTLSGPADFDSSWTRRLLGHQLVLSSFRFDRAGRLLFGSVGSLRGIGLAVHRAWAKRALAKMFPRIENVEFESQWYGMIGMTGDAVPRFHRLDANVVTFCGYNGRGIGPGTVFGACSPITFSGR